MIYRYPDSPDPAVWPSHPVGSWSHALVCIAAGVDAPADSVDALAAHDRGSRYRCGEQFAQIRALIKDVMGKYEVLTTEQVTERAVAHYPDLEPGDVEKSIMAACPMLSDPDPDDCMSGTPLPHVPVDGGATHWFSKSTVALRRAVADHERAATPSPVSEVPRHGSTPYSDDERATILETVDGLQTEQGLTLRQAAKVVGVGRHTITRWRREAREREQTPAATPEPIDLPPRRDLTEDLAETALDRVLAGEGITATARALGVSRRAVAALAA